MSQGEKILYHEKGLVKRNAYLDHCYMYVVTEFSPVNIHSPIVYYWKSCWKIVPFYRVTYSIGGNRFMIKLFSGLKMYHFTVANLVLLPGINSCLQIIQKNPLITI